MDRLSDDQIKEFFQKRLNGHIVIAVKGLFRRANLIPNKWKLRIGATHETYTKTVDYNVQMQGLPGRMTGFWKSIIEAGHKTGPYRTSIQAVKEYENTYNDPFGTNSYQTAGFKKNKGKVIAAEPTMLSVKNIPNLVAENLPIVPREKSSKPVVILTLERPDAVNKVKDLVHVKNMIKKYNIDVFTLYENYEWHCWKMNSENKYKKWGLDRLLQENAYSTETNIKDKKKDFLLVYVYGNQLLLNPWNGTAL
jgi:hypothetical protein